MTLAIAGSGWVTPLGSELQSVWTQLLKGAESIPETVSSSLNGRAFPIFRVPAAAIAGMPKHPRLRRSSPISKFAVVAGLNALANAHVEPGEIAHRLALIFAISNGGVIYTKRFFHDLVENGPKSASPLLFPETVFNAPASHLAAILGVTGTSYTLVGDATVGILALKMAEDLMATQTLDYCLVVGAEEVDWLLCDAYDKWRLLRQKPPVEPFRQPPQGMILSEGAGAVLLGCKGKIKIDGLCAGGNYSGRKAAFSSMRQIFGELEAKDSPLFIASANGTFIDRAELEAGSHHFPDARIYAMKGALGESVGASAMWQVIAGEQALLTGQVPPSLHAPQDLQPRVGNELNGVRSALVSTCGLNQQVAALRLRLDP